MSARPKDHRPKIVSFPTALDGMNIVAKQSVLWPCHAFSVSIPQKKKRGLNVFEETVLKMTEIESGATDRIALITCLERELVFFIQNRLSQLGFLDDRYELSKQGRELLQAWRSKQGEESEFTVGTVFVDLLSGKLIPYISTEQLSYKKIYRIREDGIVDFLIDPANEKSRVSARQIDLSRDSYWETIPDSNDILRVIKDFNKKYKRYALLNREIRQYPPPVPMAEAITVQKQPELIYFHCDVLIQVGNSDLLVTDGCGFGFSESFANYLTSQNRQWIIDIKGKGIIDTLNSFQGKEEIEEERIAVNKQKKYPNIEHALGRAQKHIAEAKEIAIDSTNDERELIRLSGSAVVSLYEAIEWTLRFVVADNPVSHWENLFSYHSYQDNDKILRKFAAKIGFYVSDDISALLQVKPGKIRAMDRGIFEMQPLLALTIAGAVGNPSHSLHRLAQIDSGVLTFINTLKEIRDPVLHRGSSDVEITVESLDDYRNRTVRIIQALVPEVTTEMPVTGSILDRDIDQLRLKARIDLDKSLGLGFVQSISPSLREELIKVSILNQNLSLDEEQLQQYIVLLASVLQLALFIAMKDHKPSAQNGVDLMQEAMAKIVESGFYSSTAHIPAEISTVNTNRLYHAVNGASSTLGAHLLAVFISGSDYELTQLNKSDPTFVEFIARLIHLRGHGNQLAHTFSRDDIESIKSHTFKLIKIIAEVF